MARIVNCVCMVATVLLVGCGSTSKLKTEGRGDVAGDRQFDSVVVCKFSDSAPPKKVTIDRYEIDWACGYFADMIVEEVEKTGAFASVSRKGAGDADGVSPLLISGEITRYVEGDFLGRLVVGFGVGSSYFDATVKFEDATSKQEIGRIEVDKNSLELGGAYAAGQNPKTFMDEAAKKVAREAAKLVKPQ